MSESETGRQTDEGGEHPIQWEPQCITHARRHNINISLLDGPSLPLPPPPPNPTTRVFITVHMFFIISTAALLSLY